MNILLSNDDGIKSVGIKALFNELSSDNKILIIAPDTNRTACSHSLSIKKEIKLNISKDFDGCEAYSISGFPADCVKIASLIFTEFKTEIVVAGINKAHNLGSDIFYSGTVAIAFEGAFFNKIGFAFSAPYSSCDEDFSYYAIWAKKLINYLMPYSQNNDVWNINFPSNPKLIKGIKITKLGKQLYTDNYLKTKNGKYILDGELIDHTDNEEDSDVECVKNGFISITPLLFNRTNYKKVRELKHVCEKL